MKKLYRYAIQAVDDEASIEKPDDEVVFYDGVLMIICKYSIEEDCECHQIIIDPQYKPETVMSLKDIAKKYPTVSTVIHDGALSGEVYSYGNHKYGEWELVGETVGYA